MRCFIVLSALLSTTSLARKNEHTLVNVMNPLDTVPQQTFSTLTHSDFPKHSVRVKKTNFCDGTVNAYTGYIDVEARHLFFYFFESRRSPEEDDIIFWTNGGPGASSAMGLFMELGPCRVSENGTASYHPESWNEYANIFFIDQPIGVGFSYAEHGEIVTTTEEAAKDIVAFMSIFFEHFSAFKGRPLHLAGESYAGRYLPVFASEIYDYNSKLVKAGTAPINLTSIMIGNGLTSPLAFFLSPVDIQCTNASGLEPIMPIGSCVNMRIAVKRCRQWIQSECIDKYDAMSCTAATDYCTKAISGDYIAARRNPYDVSKVCEEDECYPKMWGIEKFLNLPATRHTIGVEGIFHFNFSSLNDQVNTDFIKGNDHLAQTYLYVAELLERGVSVLIYAGMYDFVCNWVGIEQWTRELEWSGHDAFASISLKEWKAGGQPAGLVRSANGLTFATIYKAGHLVPYDRPKESLEMVRKWLAKERF